MSRLFCLTILFFVTPAWANEPTAPTPEEVALQAAATTSCPDTTVVLSGGTYDLSTVRGRKALQALVEADAKLTYVSSYARSRCLRDLAMAKSQGELSTAAAKRIHEGGNVIVESRKDAINVRAGDKAADPARGAEGEHGNVPLRMNADGGRLSANQAALRNNGTALGTPTANVGNAEQRAPETAEERAAREQREAQIDAIYAAKRKLRMEQAAKSAESGG